MTNPLHTIRDWRQRRALRKELGVDGYTVLWSAKWACFVRLANNAAGGFHIEAIA